MTLSDGAFSNVNYNETYMNLKSLDSLLASNDVQFRNGKLAYVAETNQFYQLDKFNALGSGLPTRSGQGQWVLASIGSGGGGGDTLAFLNRVDCSVNSANVSNAYGARPILQIRTGGNVAGGFNGIGLGNKSILGFSGFDGIALSTLTSFSYRWRDMAPGNSPFLPYANLVVDINGNDTVYKIFVMSVPGPVGSNPFSIIVNGDGTTTYTHIFGSNDLQVVNDIPPVVPYINVGVPWQSHSYRLSDILASYPSARLRDIASGDAGLPKSPAITPSFLLIQGDSNTNRIGGTALYEVFFNGTQV